MTWLCRYAFQFRGKTKRVVGYLVPLSDEQQVRERLRVAEDLGYKTTKGVVFARMGMGSRL